MDYEKEYRAMVQRCKELHDSGNTLTKMQMEVICPELADGDNMRNAIILSLETLKNYISKDPIFVDDPKTGFYDHIDKEIAWLEKQIPTKRKEWSENDKKMLASLLEACRFAEDRNNFDNAIEVKSWLMTSLIPKKEWSLDDQIHLDNCLNIVLRSGGDRFYDDYKWLKSLKER